jgi:hypothetical protein
VVELCAVQHPVLIQNTAATAACCNLLSTCGMTVQLEAAVSVCRAATGAADVTHPLWCLLHRCRQALTVRYHVLTQHSHLAIIHCRPFLRPRRHVAVSFCNGEHFASRHIHAQCHGTCGYSSALNQAAGLATQACALVARVDKLSSKKER